MIDKIKKTFDVLDSTIESELKAYELELTRALAEYSKDTDKICEQIIETYEKSINEKLSKFLFMIKSDATARATELAETAKVYGNLNCVNIE